jgi:flagellar biosynthesis protein FlhF
MQQYFVEQGASYVEAEKKASEKYGENLTILMHESVKIPGGFLNLFSRDGVKLTGIIPLRKSGVQYLPQQLYKEQPPAKETPRQALDFAVEKEKVLAAANAGKDNASKEILAEIGKIKEKLESFDLAGSKEEHPTLNRIDDILILNDFPASYRKAMLERARKEITLDGLNNYQAVQDKVLEWIGESIKIYDAGKFNIRPRIMILVGPTGVGKTTTVAKLAANFGIDEKGHHKRRVVLITIDAYRIGAKQQLEVYSSVMDFPCFSVADYEELKKAIDLNSEGTDLFLIDTIGKSPRDMVQLGEMKQLLNACGTLADVHLALAASTKSSDINEILKTFEAFGYKSVIVTKMDETIRTGNIIGALSERAKPVSYMTTGQKVPTDIRKASVIQFLINLEGFKVNRIKLEEKFPDKGQEQMQRWR